MVVMKNAKVTKNNGNEKGASVAANSFPLPFSLLITL